MARYFVKTDDHCSAVFDRRTDWAVAKVWFIGIVNDADVNNKTQAVKLARSICKLYNQAQVKE